MSITILGRQSTVGFLQSSTKSPATLRYHGCAMCTWLPLRLRACLDKTGSRPSRSIHGYISSTSIIFRQVGGEKNIVKTALGPSVPIQRPSWNNQQWYFLNGLNGFGLWGLTLYPIGLTSLTRLHSEVNARVSSPSSSARPSLLQVTWRYDALRVGNFHGQLVMVDWPNVTMRLDKWNSRKVT